MHKLWAAGAAMSLGLALGGLPVVAQDESPGGVSGEMIEPVAVTGTEACTITKWGVMTFSDGVERFRDHLLDCLDTMSDPRVSGHYTNHFNYDCYGGDACIFWGTHVLDGPDGGWDCSYTGTTNPTTAYEYLVLLVCPGTGTYDGLTYTTYHVFNMNDESADFGNGMSFGGLIYQDPPPPWGPLPTAASE